MVDIEILSALSQSLDEQALLIEGAIGEGLRSDPMDVLLRGDLLRIAGRLQGIALGLRAQMPVPAPADLTRRQQLARDAVHAETLAVRIAWGLTGSASFIRMGEQVEARIVVDWQGHPYAVVGHGTDESEARCRLRDAVVNLFDERNGTAAS